MVTATLLAALVAQVSLSDGRAVVHDVAAGRTEALWRRASPALRKEAGTPAGLARRLAHQKRYGVEQREISERLEQHGTQTVYTRAAAYSLWARGVEETVVFDAQGRVDDVSLASATHAAPTVYGRYQVKTRLTLPVEDEVQVLWGGRTWEDNRHAAVPDMRFALDLWMKRDGHTSRGSGRANSQYYCWSAPVVAPADGVVVQVRDGVPDNPPGHIASTVLYGNHLVIDHGNGEYTLLAHLRRGSLAVKPGARVTRGQRLARVGNSGFSTEPHLHYQLMDAADYRTAQGLPARFRDYVADGQRVPGGEPQRGQTIAPAEASDVARRDDATVRVQ
jgi:hypothetical protein